MARGSRLTRLDAFTKTVEDARVRTTTGGVVTISSILLILFLIISEWRDYSRIVIRPELVVDKTRGTLTSCFVAFPLEALQSSTHLNRQ